MTGATDRFRMLLAGALERVCVLEAQLEERDQRIAELEDKVALYEVDVSGLTDETVRMEEP